MARITNKSVKSWPYGMRKALADKIIYRYCGLSWDDLADINSLHDCETSGDILGMCQERLREEGFEFGDEIELVEEQKVEQHGNG
jgi:hypothetical protein